MVFSGRLSGRRQRTTASYVLPRWVGANAGYRHPGLDVGLASRGLRQWLRIHPLAPGGLAIPSLVVQNMWADLLRDPVEAATFSKLAYSYRTRRSPKRAALIRSATRRVDGRMALTFALACRDEGLARYQTRLPALFAVDNTLAGGGARRWVLNCGGSACQAATGIACVNHDLVDLIPLELPRQVPHQEHASYPPVDMDDSLAFGYHSGGTFSGLGG